MEDWANGGILHHFLQSMIIRNVRMKYALGADEVIEIRVDGASTFLGKTWYGCACQMIHAGEFGPGSHILPECIVR